MKHFHDTEETMSLLQLRAIGDPFIYRRRVRWRAYTLLAIIVGAAGYQFLVW